MSFEKLPILDQKDIHVGCLTCSTSALVAPMDMVIAVGFGSAIVTKDDQLIYSEDRIENDAYWTVRDAENLAIQDPDHDWRIEKHGALHGETFQRQGVAYWVCVESNEGFA